MAAPAQPYNPDATGDYDTLSRGWMVFARCREYPPELWYPRYSTGRNARATNTAHERRAKTICGDCPVRARCLEYALAIEKGRAARERWGIYGGFTPEERARLEMHR